MLNVPIGRSPNTPTAMNINFNLRMASNGFIVTFYNQRTGDGEQTFVFTTFEDATSFIYSFTI